MPSSLCGHHPFKGLFEGSSLGFRIHAGCASYALLTITITEACSRQQCIALQPGDGDIFSSSRPESLRCKGLSSNIWFHPAGPLWVHIRLQQKERPSIQRHRWRKKHLTALSPAVSVTGAGNVRSAALLSLSVSSHPDRNTFCTTSWCVTLSSVPYMALEETVPVW